MTGATAMTTSEEVEILDYQPDFTDDLVHLRTPMLLHGCPRIAAAFPTPTPTAVVVRSRR